MDSRLNLKMKFPDDVLFGVFGEYFKKHLEKLGFDLTQPFEMSITQEINDGATGAPEGSSGKAK